MSASPRERSHFTHQPVHQIKISFWWKGDYLDSRTSSRTACVTGLWVKQQQEKPEQRCWSSFHMQGTYCLGICKRYQHSCNMAQWSNLFWTLKFLLVKMLYAFGFVSMGTVAVMQQSWGGACESPSSAMQRSWEGSHSLFSQLDPAWMQWPC